MLKSVSFLSDGAGAPAVSPLVAERDGGGRVKRVKVLSIEQKEQISQLTCWEDLPTQERKRQREALKRAMTKSDKTMKPGVFEKWTNATTPAATSWPKKFVGSTHLLHHMLRFEFLKTWLLDPSMESMQVESWYTRPLS